SGGFRCGGAVADLPRARLVVARREERDQVQGPVAGRDHGLEPRLIDTELLQERARFRRLHLGDLGLDRGIDPDGIAELVRYRGALLEVRDHDLGLQAWRSEPPKE